MVGRMTLTAATDVNGDGFIDIVADSIVVDDRDVISILPGNGDGSFGAELRILPPPPPHRTSAVYAGCIL